jgi:hypothetical protein
MVFSVSAQHNIGRPRFAVCPDERPELQGGVLSAQTAIAMRQVRDSHTAANLSSEDRTALFDWWKRRELDWQKAHKLLADHEAKVPTSKATVLICGEGYPALRMNTQGADFFNETYFLKRGNADLKDGVAPQGFLQVLMHQPDAKHWEWTPPDGAKYSGRRRSLSNWIVDVDKGAGSLLARVIVNRLWQHHMGRGIAATPNDFGRQGALPSEPELLDWLARQLIAEGWKLKPLHKQIMMSAAYQQAVMRDTGKESADPVNDWFMRRIPQRLEAEAIRDSMLFVSGQLDATLFGPGTRNETSRRRSIYFNIKRSLLIGSMVAFDAPEPLVSQGLRPTTTVAPQALMIMNSPQVRSWVEALVRRLQSDCRADASDAKLVERAYALCFGRQPQPDELQAAEDFLTHQRASYTADKKSDAAAQSLADYCQVLFGLNEFVYQP